FLCSFIMVEGDKPPKDKEQASSSKGNGIDQYVPLFLHNNDTSRVPLINFRLEDVFMGQVFSKNAKVVWDELEETYSNQDAYVIFNMHHKIHSLSQSGSALSEYYHKFNALWRQYDFLVNLPDYICENSEKLKNHNQLLKLMQFLMGLDEVYAPIRSIILTTDPIPDVKGAFATLSRDESHMSTQSHNVSRIDKQFKILMALISEKSGSASILTNVADVSKLNMTVGHPNGTKAVVTHIGSLKLIDKITINDVLVVLDYQDSVLRTQVGTGSESNGLYFLNTGKKIDE
ncbi:ribonuclease H-like domain-containing protein, partial [Tanacetum coccineum]